MSRLPSLWRVGPVLTCCFLSGCTTLRHTQAPFDAAIEQPVDAAVGQLDAGRADGDSGDPQMSTDAVDARTPAEPEPPPHAADEHACDFEADTPHDVTTDNPKCPNGIYSGDLTLTDDNFADLRGCLRMRGALIIATDKRRDLSGLEALRVIDGELVVMTDCDPDDGCFKRPELTSLHGLEHLRCVSEDVSIGPSVGWSKLDCRRRLM